MKLDKHTFGDTPAAVYLVDTLNKSRNDRLARKISAKLTELRATLHELRDAYATEIMSQRTFGALLSAVKRNFFGTRDALIGQQLLAEDVLAAQLFGNIGVGEIKRLEHRYAQGKHDSINARRRVDKLANQISAAAIQDCAIIPRGLMKLPPARTGKTFEQLWLEHRVRYIAKTTTKK